MSLNLNYRVAKHGRWEERLPLIVDAIQKANADVIAFQAVECIDDRSQTAEIAARLGYAHEVFVAASCDGSVKRGSAFVSRRPLAELAVQTLTRVPGHDDCNDRVVVRTSIKTESGALALYNAHFSWITPQALANARETLDFRTAKPAVLLGDLNSAPASPAIKTLQEGGWVDLWSVLRPNDPGYTFEADRPVQRIDYAFGSPELRRRVLSIDRVVANGPWPRLSDHLGLLVCLHETGTTAH